MLDAPRQLVAIASLGKYSHEGTCFSAAALTTMSARLSAEHTAAKSRTSPMRNSSTCMKLRYTTSSVVTLLCRYDRRIECCLASSRETTRPFRGVPCSPLKRRRPSPLPSEPVPPVTSTVLSSNSIGGSPCGIGCRVGRQCRHHFAPRRRRASGCAPEPLAIEVAADHRTVHRFDRDVAAERWAREQQQIVFRDGFGRHLIQAGQIVEALDQLSHQVGKVQGRYPGIELIAKALGRPAAVLHQEPFEQRGAVLDLATYDRQPQ